MNGGNNNELVLLVKEKLLTSGSQKFDVFLQMKRETWSANQYFSPSTVILSLINALGIWDNQKDVLWHESNDEG